MSVDLVLTSLWVYNSNVPSVLKNQLPVLEEVSSSKIIANNLNALHAARRAFVQRALCHQIQPSTGIKFTNGDWIYFKRDGTVSCLYHFQNPLIIFIAYNHV